MSAAFAGGAKAWRLLGAGGAPYDSATPGLLGGHRRQKIYGGLDCRSALRAIARGTYQKNRVFFADAATARAAGYRPCAVCMPADYRRWRVSGGPFTRAPARLDHVTGPAHQEPT